VACILIPGKRTRNEKTLAPPSLQNCSKADESFSKFNFCFQ